MELSSFKNFDDALSHYNMKESDIYIKIIEHPKSFERFSSKNRLLYIIGEGLKSSPGYPSGNQLWHNQFNLINKFNVCNYIPVFRTALDGTTEYVGKYVLKSFRKKIADNGFTYYEYTLLKKEKGSI